MPPRAQLEEWVSQLLRAREDNALKPCYSLMLEAVDLSDAYWVLDEMVKRTAVAIAGFKGALTQVAAQKSFNASGPACGVLLETMLQPMGKPVSCDHFKRGAIETEIGFVISETIQGPIQARDIPQVTSAMMPMVELVDVGFEHQPIALVDLVANNAAAKFFLCGEGVPIGEPDDIQIELFKEGELLHSALAGDVYKGQLQAAAWLVNQTMSRGYRIEQGQILMTGSAGKVQPLLPGFYEARYGGMPSIEFEVLEGQA
jgi:2-keto-4-pentenoate hydratase